MSEICTTCGLPQDLCVCETIAKETQEIKLRIIKKKFGKKYTIIEGIVGKEINLKDVTKRLKNKLACGGTVKGDTIELQGDHRAKVKLSLIDMGFTNDTINVE